MGGLKLGWNDIGNQDYHDDREYISSSGLKLLLKDPRTFYKKYVKEEEGNEFKSDSLDFGSYVHSLLLEPELVESEYAFYSGTKRGKDWEAFKTENCEKTIITATQRMHASQMQGSFVENKWAVDLCTGGQAEQTLCVEMGGVPVKVRYDYFKETEGIIDIKTTRYGVTLEEIQSTILQWDYDLSAALYVDAYKEHTGIELPFYFIFLSKQYLATEVFCAGSTIIENGRRKYKEAIRRLKECRATGRWFNRGIQRIELPTGSEYHGQGEI